MLVQYMRCRQASDSVSVTAWSSVEMAGQINLVFGAAYCVLILHCVKGDSGVFWYFPLEPSPKLELSCAFFRHGTSVVASVINLV